MNGIFRLTVIAAVLSSLAAPGYAASAKEIKSRAERLLLIGVDMERYRNTRDLDAIGTCGDLMRKYMPQAKQLRSDADALPGNPHLMLKAATIDLSMCVTCSDWAAKSCERTARSLREYEERMALE